MGHLLSGRLYYLFLKNNTYSITYLVTITSYKIFIKQVSNSVRDQVQQKRREMPLVTENSMRGTDLMISIHLPRWTHTNKQTKTWLWYSRLMREHFLNEKEKSNSVVARVCDKCLIIPILLRCQVKNKNKQEPTWMSVYIHFHT